MDSSNSFVTINTFIDVTATDNPTFQSNIQQLLNKQIYVFQEKQYEEVKVENDYICYKEKYHDQEFFCYQNLPCHLFIQNLTENKV